MPQPCCVPMLEICHFIQGFYISIKSLWWCKCTFATKCFYISLYHYCCIKCIEIIYSVRYTLQFMKAPVKSFDLRF